MNCTNCSKNHWLFDEDGAYNYCMEKGAKVTEQFASETHLCFTNEELEERVDGHA